MDGMVGWMDLWKHLYYSYGANKSLMNFSPVQTTVHRTRASWIWSRAVLYSSPWLGLVPLLICFVYRPLSFAPVAEPWLTGGLPQEFPRVIQISLEFLSYFFGISLIFLWNFFHISSEFLHISHHSKQCWIIIQRSDLSDYFRTH